MFTRCRRTRFAIVGRSTPAMLLALIGFGSAVTPSSAQAAEPLPPDLQLVRSDALGFLHVRVADLWKQKSMKEIRDIVLKAGPKALAALDEQFVPKPSTIDRVTAIVTPLRERGEPGFIAVLRFSEAFDAEQVGRTYVPNGIVKKVGGKTILTTNLGEVAVVFPDDRTAMFSDLKTLEAYFSKPVKAGGGLSDALKLAANKPFTLALNIASLPIPPNLAENLDAEVKPLLKAQTATITVDFGEEATIDTRLHFPNEADAVQGEKALRKAIEMARPFLQMPRRELERELFERHKDIRPRPVEDLPIAVGSVAGLGALNYLDEILAKPPIKQNQNSVALTVTMPGFVSNYVSLTAISAGLMLPAVQKVREAAARAQVSNNLKQIGLAMHNYHDTYQAFPSAAITDKKGKKLLSWRVAILPYIEQQALYQQFKLDEPWDSEHNKKLINILPKVYADPRLAAPAGMTYYKVFVGPKAGFDWDKKRKIFKITDGTSNTIMAVAGGDPVIWTKPDDIEFDPKKELPDLSKPFGNLLTVFFDGSVRTLAPSAAKDQKLMKLLIQPDDGQVIPNFE